MFTILSRSDTLFIHLLNKNVGFMSLDNASPELQLAVDLIYLLECNEIDPATALAALDIVKRDYQEKLQRNGVTTPYLPVEQ